MPNPKIIGNQFWKVRSSHGRKPIFKTPEDLRNACEEYFEWVGNTPLYEARPFAYEGEITMAEIPKMRAMTIGGLSIFLDIAHETFLAYGKKSDDFSEIVEWAKETIKQQKFSGAAAGLLNANIIARDLGLVDKKGLAGNDGGPVQIEDVSKNDLGRRLAFALRSAAEE